MTEVVIARPDVILKDYQGQAISAHPHEFQATTAAELQPAGTFTVERPLVTITIKAAP